MDISAKFEQIEKEYKSYYNSILKQGKLIVKDTEKGIWGTVSAGEMLEFCRKISLKNKKFLDIGSGDGKVALIASLFAKSATGIEFDEDLLKKGVEIRDRLGLECTFIRGDYMEHDFSQYDLLFINPDKGFHHGIEDKLLEEMKGKLYVYNFVFQPRFLSKGKQIWVSQVPVTEFSQNLRFEKK